jgi:hypothetical protein
MIVLEFLNLCLASMVTGLMAPGLLTFGLVGLTIGVSSLIKLRIGEGLVMIIIGAVSGYLLMWLWKWFQFVRSGELPSWAAWAIFVLFLGEGLPWVSRILDEVNPRVQARKNLARYFDLDHE